MICLGMHYNVMLCFMVQAFQDPPLCSSTLLPWPQHPPLPILPPILIILFSNLLTFTVPQQKTTVFTKIFLLHREFWFHFKKCLSRETFPFLCHGSEQLQSAAHCLDFLSFLSDLIAVNAVHKSFTTFAFIIAKQSSPLVLFSFTLSSIYLKGKVRNC